ncbi:N(4)-(beta-N-acetylglucosaminyl)-L-asparaginase [Sphingopyxis soli]|uniref:N(4)-(Beta-N-acetylglucosaminyl)-L-asparaginase n=1 Tax=Sphingopyxis soli TaxID=592051 RepID=A0ABP3XDG5_9SPHN|nr:N(4)-(beta-N-acetylglucosaminyl)-L-asparaginase [Sphingopyxis soli]
MTDKAISRRFFGAAAAGLAALGIPGATAKPAAPKVIPTGKPFILTTWDFGPGANAVGWPMLASGASAIDAVEAAINHVELLGDYWVGAGGVPNEVGETTLDAMMMWGPTHDLGAVGCLKRVKKAISVARAVMEKTQHSLIVGDDATRFAARMGFTETTLTSVVSQQAWDKWAAKGERTNAFDPEPIRTAEALARHDTVGSIALDAAGNLCVGCSTNGREFKIPGRVGDSPIAGAGAYVDQAVGGAVATGNGDVMMRFLPTYHAVELMLGGMAPQAAAEAAIKRIEDAGYSIGGGIAVIRRDGVHGGAKTTGWEDTQFSYSVQTATGNVKVPVS